MKESLKPIEPGCLALVIPTEEVHENAVHLLGVIVDVGSRYDGRKRGEECACGKVKRDCTWWVESGRFGCCERILMRIDPDDEIREEVWLEPMCDLERMMRKAGVWSG